MMRTLLQLVFLFLLAVLMLAVLARIPVILP
jgi:hypothetical protein